ncbi:Lrp/AsnC family transcriptional regulator [Candidatus Woesearchaeota archaeon]|nr:MAG: Lrp/AsnC family transcriptional regulator [Candidatus Woesearchaeota archaeon]
MVSKKDALILCNLRRNSRQSIAKIGKNSGIPASTVFDRLRKLEGNIISKYVSLIDFQKIGYHIRLFFVFKAFDKEKLKKFLINHQNINSVHSVHGENDFFVEAVFKDLNQFESFLEDLNNNEIKEKDYYYVVEELKRESFLSEPEHFY